MEYQTTPLGKPIKSYQPYEQHNEYITLQKGAPKIITKGKNRQFYKIVLRSVDLDVGNVTDCTFQHIALPTGLKKNAVVLVDSLYIDNVSNTLNGQTFHLHIQQLPQKRSYSTDKQGLTDIVATFQGYTYMNLGQDDGSLGVCVIDPVFFQHNSLRVYFTRIDNSTVQISTNWVLTLFVVELEDDALEIY